MYVVNLVAGVIIQKQTLVYKKRTKIAYKNRKKTQYAKWKRQTRIWWL